MNVMPLRDFMVVKKEESVNKTAGGLFIDRGDEKVVTGKVLAVGTGRVADDGSVIALEVKVGDRVAFNKSLSSELTVDGETFLMLREEHVYCVVK